jgi:hypothetical protein
MIERLTPTAIELNCLAELQSVLKLPAASGAQTSGRNLRSHRQPQQRLSRNYWNARRFRVLILKAQSKN